MQSFRYDFTLKELLYFLFGKKVCPKCEGRLEKEKCCETVDGSIFNTNDVPLYIQGRRIKHYFYRYTCKKCDEKFTLSELANSQRNRRLR